tara:strand:+ start:1975 stop:3375 length:1401 start_codon:yes stop_codon:yes gene_type:complete
LFHRLILLAFLGSIGIGAELSHAQQFAVAPQFAGAVVPIPSTNSYSGAGDPYATVALQSPMQWLGNGPLFGGGWSYGAGSAGGTAPGVLAAPIVGAVPLVGNADPAVGRLWMRAEYLNWWTDGMKIPALVTTSPDGNAQDTAAVLGEDGTSVLLGNSELNEGSSGGFRFSGGFWITPQRTFAVESEYFQLAEQNDGYFASGEGSPILGRPYFNIVTGQETAQLISYPGLVSGSVSIGSETDLRSFLINGRVALCPTHGAGCNSCGPQDRTDWIVGYRRLVLEDSLSFHETLTSELTNAPGTIVLNEGFHTENEFNGLQLGVVNITQLRRAWLESKLRIALGNNTQTVRIHGSTAITEAGITDTFDGGLYAQRTNIGSYQREHFTLIPEIGLKLGVRLTDRAFVTVGYSVLYFPSVLRAGDQIDTDINPNLIPPEVVPLTGALRPRFRYIESDYLAHGISLGGELRF